MCRRCRAKGYAGFVVSAGAQGADFARPSGFYRQMKLPDPTNLTREVYEAAVPVIRKGQEQGEFVTKYPPLIIVQMAIQTFFGALYFWSMEQGDAKLSDHVALTMELFFDGVSA